MQNNALTIPVLISGLGTMAILNGSKQLKEITFAIIGVMLVILGLQQIKKA